MASKRMFDRDLMRTANFISLSNGAKSLYFLCGIEADDWGFVDQKLVMRTFEGFNNDDLTTLLVRGFFIPFQTGVVVIKDWHKNNYLNSKRSKPTEYQKELEALTINSEAEYLKIEDHPGARPAKEVLLSWAVPFAKRHSKGKGRKKSLKRVLNIGLTNVKQENIESGLAEVRPLLNESLPSIGESIIEKVEGGFSNEKLADKEEEGTDLPPTPPVASFAPPEKSYMEMSPEEKDAYMIKYHNAPNPIQTQETLD